MSAESPACLLLSYARHSDGDTCLGGGCSCDFRHRGFLPLFVKLSGWEFAIYSNL